MGYTPQEQAEEKEKFKQAMNRIGMPLNGRLFIPGLAGAHVKFKVVSADKAKKQTEGLIRGNG